MVKESADYSKILEDIRHIYKQKYNVALDDELLYIIIRVNELQVSLNKKIDDIPKVTFPTGKDYFLYSFGKYLPFLFVGLGLILLSCFLFIYRSNSDLKTYEVISQPKGISVKLKGYNDYGDTTVFLTEKKGNIIPNNPRPKK